MFKNKNTSLKLLLSLSFLVSSCQNFQTKNGSVNSSSETTQKTRLYSSLEPRLIQFDYKPFELKKQCEQKLKNVQNDLENILKTPEKEQNFKTTFLEFEKVNSEFYDYYLNVNFLKKVTKVDYIRSESIECINKIAAFKYDFDLRKDVYLFLKKQVPQTVSEKRLYTHTIKYYELSGFMLPDDKLEQIDNLFLELDNLNRDFGRLFANDIDKIEFTEDESQGLSADFLKSLTRLENGHYQVKLNGSNYVEILENAKIESLRKRAFESYLTKGGDQHIEHLKKILQLRFEVAKELGYETWADYKLQERMAKNKKNVLDFIYNLKQKLTKGSKEDLLKLKKWSQELHLKNPQESKINIKPWNIDYLKKQYLKSKLNVNHEKIKEYLPVESVVSGVFKTYEKLLGVEFREVTGHKFWASDVKLFSVMDQESQKIIAYFYTDLFARAQKYIDAASVSLVLGRELSDGRYATPVSAIITNFNRGTVEKPALLSFSQVKTFFHEFGYIMHGVLTKAPYSSLSVISVERDFVEAPSLMFENWLKDKTVFDSISGHYTDAKRKLSDRDFNLLMNSEKFMQSYSYSRQLMLAELDLNLHTNKSLIDDPEAEYRRLYTQSTGMTLPKTSRFTAGFAHLNLYDACYYGYLWSEVFALDMFSKFKNEGLLNPKVGLHYRKTILEQGSMKSGDELLFDFLGRKPDSKAFLKNLGL